MDSVRTMKALSIRQPWPWAIFHAGKDVENRDWKDWSPSLHMAKRLARTGEEFLIHASKGMTNDEFDDFDDFVRHLSQRNPFPSNFELPAKADLRRGGIVGIARIKAVVTESESPWFMGTIGLVLSDVRELPFEPLSGALGFFDVSRNVPAPEGE